MKTSGVHRTLVPTQALCRVEFTDEPTDMQNCNFYGFSKETVVSDNAMNNPLVQPAKY
jgi:hypothetical protein